MNCKRIQSLIALLVGNDLDDAETLQVERHIATCPHCRAYHQEMQASYEALQNSADETVYESQPSLWPQLSARLFPTTTPQNTRSQAFNGWIPALAITAATLMIMVFSNTRHQTPDWAETSSPRPAFERPDAFAVGNSFDEPSSRIERREIFPDTRPFDLKLPNGPTYEQNGYETRPDDERSPFIRTIRTH